MEVIFALFTMVFSAGNSVYFFASAPRAKNKEIFVTLFSKVQPSGILGFNEFFKDLLTSIDTIVTTVIWFKKFL